MNDQDFAVLRHGKMKRKALKKRIRRLSWAEGGDSNRVSDKKLAKKRRELGFEFLKSIRVHSPDNSPAKKQELANEAARPANLARAIGLRYGEDCE